MKKLLFILCAVFTISAHAQFSGSGSGTTSDPYLIYNENQLYQMNNFLGNDNAGVVFKLMKDLDLTDFINENFPTEGWQPVGVSSSPFKGVFLGNNHKISGVYINRGSAGRVGFFGYASNATIKELTLEATTITGYQYVGTLIGYAETCTITSCNVKATSVMADAYAGGVFGSVNSNSQVSSIIIEADVSSSGCSACFAGVGKKTTITNIEVRGNVTGQNMVAGIIALESESVSISNASFVGKVDGTGQYVAGAIAHLNTGTVLLNNIKIEANISGVKIVGGIVGVIGSGATCSFENCHHKGNIINSGDYTGGIVGYSNGQRIEKMETCSHFGDITGNNFIGGLAGYVCNSESRPEYWGSTSSTENTKTTGFFYAPVEDGIRTIKIVNNCTSIGNIKGQHYVGGLFGKDDLSITYSQLYLSGPIHKNGGNLSLRDKNLYLWKNNYYTETDHTYIRADNFEQYYHFKVSDTRDYTCINITNSYYSGNIEGKYYVGGIAGSKTGGSIQNSYTNASCIQGTQYVGGIAGHIAGFSSTEDNSSIEETINIKSNVAINSTVSATVGDVGRIYGKKGDDNVTIGALGSKDGNRALTSTTLVKQGVVQEITDNLQNGNVMGAGLLKLKANYVALGWDFDNYWNIQETESYPYKKYQAAPPVIESSLVSQETSISGSSYNGGTVYLFYKDREAVFTTCNGNNWSFSTEPLQSGAPVQLYADVEGLTPSYFTSTTVGYPGSGTEADPYRIYTAEDLQGASNKGYYKLMNDIDLTSWINENSPTEGWVSIGRNSGEATYINGDGHKVTGLWINTTQDYTGLFSNFSAGVIKNLTVEVATGKKVKGGDYTGILIGRNTNGQLLNCTVKGDVEGTTYVGGVTGYSANNTVNAVTFEGSVTSTANKSNVGGVIGFSYKNTINAVTFEGSVTSAANNAYVGGVAGQSLLDEIISVHANSTINTSGEQVYAGGIFGLIDMGSITKSHAETMLIATGKGSYVGGMIGKNSYSNVSLSFSTGEVTCSGDSAYSGGLVGYTTGGQNTITDCYSTAHVSGTYFTAGICAYSYSTISRCYASGNIDGIRYGAGVVGELDGTSASLTNSIAANNTISLTDQASWGCRVIGGFKNGAAEPDNSNFALSTMQVSLNGVPQRKTDDPVEGIAKQDSLLKTRQFYTDLGWNYSSVWAINEGEGYPYLVWEHLTENIALNKDAIILKEGTQETIIATATPAEAAGVSISWTSSNNSVATVNNGIITAVGPGTAIITATAEDGSEVTAICNVTVVKNLDNAIAGLQAYIDSAQAICDNAVEGIYLDEYAAGAKATLQGVINEVSATISAMMSEEAITEGTSMLDAALAEFESKRITSTNIDYSTVNDIIYINNVSSASGTQITLPVILNNTDNISDIQFDIMLPTGVTIAKDEDDFELIEVGERTTAKKHSVDCLDQPDGSVRIMCTSSRGYTFEGNSGTVLLMTLNLGEIEDGDYTIRIKNAISSNAGNTYHLPNIAATISIVNFVLGDINGDGEINVGDLSRLVNMILNDYSTPGAIFKAADINGDGELNVGDYSRLVQMILNAPVSGSKGFAGVALSKNYTAALLSAEIDEGISQIALYLKNNGKAFNSMQFDVVLPEGLSIDMDAISTTARTHGMDIYNNGTRVVVSGLADNVIKDEDGAVLYLPIKAESTAGAGTYEVEFANAVLGTVEGNAVYSHNFSTPITTNDLTGISSSPKSSMLNAQSIFDLNGRKVADPKNGGIYIINGKKVKAK